MTVITPEDKKEVVVNQEKIDAIPPQQQKVENEKPNNDKPNVGTSPEITEDPNWRAFREARKKDRAEKEAAERKAAEKEAEVAALKAAMEAAFSKGNPVAQQQQQYDYGHQEETEDERIDKKVQAALAARESIYQKERAEREQQEAPQRIQQTFPDFKNIVNQENCDYIDYHYPELSAPFKYMPEGYEKWAAMYNLIKKMVPNSATAKKEAARAEANFNKPKSMSSTSLTQSGESASARLTEDRKAQNWERMQKLLKGVG